MNLKKVLIKRFEPAKHKFGQPEDSSLEEVYNHPDRYCISVAFIEMKNGIPYCRETGREGGFLFPDNFCPKYLGEYPAVILGETDLDSLTQDWFLPYD